MKANFCEQPILSTTSRIAHTQRNNKQWENWLLYLAYMESVNSMFFTTKA